MRKFFSGGPENDEEFEQVNIVINEPVEEVDPYRDPKADNPDEDDDEAAKQELLKKPVKRRRHRTPQGDIETRHKSEKYQQFVNEVFKRRRKRTFIWTMLIFLFDMIKLTIIATCFSIICGIHVGVMKGAWILECLIIFLSGLAMCVIGELGLTHLLFRPSGFAFAEWRLNTCLIFMLIGSGLQFSQLVPFGVDETVENSYKFNNKGNQELCRQFAHRKLKISFREETLLCAAWHDPHWLTIKIITAMSLCVNIISFMCLMEYLCFSRYYYLPGRTVWREYTQYRKFLAGKGQLPLSPIMQRSPNLSPRRSEEVLTPSQSRLLKKFADYEPNAKPRSSTYLHVDS